MNSLICVFQEGDENSHPTACSRDEVRQGLKNWLDYQDGQKILLTTPTVLVGYRLEVYRAEGTTQWYTAVIQSYNHTTKVLLLFDMVLSFRLKSFRLSGTQIGLIVQPPEDSLKFKCFDKIVECHKVKMLIMVFQDHLLVQKSVLWVNAWSCHEYSGLNEVFEKGLRLSPEK